MKYHYIPAINEAEFNRIAKEADPVLTNRRKRAVMTDLVNRRNALFRELHDLRTKSGRSMADEKQKRWSSR